MAGDDRRPSSSDIRIWQWRALRCAAHAESAGGRAARLIVDRPPAEPELIEDFCCRPGPWTEHKAAKWEIASVDPYSS